MEVIEFLIDEELKMLEAMQQLDEVAKKILFVTRDGHFAAAITDVTSEDKSQIPVRGREKQNKRVYKKHSNAALPSLDKYLTKKTTSLQYSYEMMSKSNHIEN